MFLIFQRSRHRHCHLLLLRSILEVLCLGENPFGRKHFFDLDNQAGTGGLGVVEADHAK